jgi:hypothetical protein
MELIEKVLDGGTVSLTCGEQNEPRRRMRVQAAVNASRHWFAASARRRSASRLRQFNP